MDQSYCPISSETCLSMLEGEKIVVKKTIETKCGFDVRFFSLENNQYVDIATQKPFSIEYLQHTIGSDFIVQSFLTQSKFMSTLCSTSVNTLRIFTYRSVKTNLVHVLQAVLRVGYEGSMVDNAHQGGRIVGINLDSGQLNPYLRDVNGKKHLTHNGINYSDQKLIIPDWDKIILFTKRCAEQIPHLRCLNFDIAIDKGGCPRLIEFNIDSMGIWLFQENTGPCYGEYTEEVINYCRSNIDKVKSPYLTL